MSLEQATAAIAAKQAELKKRGLTFGKSLGAVTAAGSGGFVQKYERVHIYWHANTGAHAVYGPILDAYRKFGGPGNHPETGAREFGYPKADPAPTAFGAQLGQFEFGKIVDVPGHRGVALCGAFSRTSLETLGLPVTEPMRSTGGQVLYCTEGCYFMPDAIRGRVYRATLRCPQIGRPAMLAATNANLPINLVMNIHAADWEKLKAAQGGTDAAAVRMFEDLWRDRLVVQSVRSKSQTVATKPTVTVTAKTSTSASGATSVTRVVEWTLKLTARSTISPRTLLNIRLRTPEGSLAIAPHSVYTEPTWKRFGFLHATDLHVIRRGEQFRNAVHGKSAGDSVRTIVNPNDSVRALFNYANELHDNGLIDFIIATGDLVDYVFEKGDDEQGGGNFRYLERLILGDAPSVDKEGPANEELRVPIFTVLGNHDYVKNPSKLIFSIDLQWPVKNRKIAKYQSFNMVRTDAKLVEGGLPLVSVDEAKEMTESFKEPPAYYARRINRSQSYTISLAKRHTIVMLDTGPNADILDGTADTLQKIFGGLDEDESNFVRGLPSSTSGEFSYLERRLKEERPPGIVVVGMHNPPLNTSGHEFEHYFRETERPGLTEDALQRLMMNFLVRTGNFPLVQHPSWSVKPTPYFKSGSIDDLLDFGVVKWKDRKDLLDFFALCLDRRVDAVFCGHVHERVEFRVARVNKEYRFFTDFYTENPPAFRESHYNGLGQDERLVHILVRSTAKAGGTPKKQREAFPNGFVEHEELRVPSYPNPLSAAKDKAAWWSAHRPLILQTACVGPIDYSQRGASPNDGNTIKRRRISFQGIRWIRVNGDAISNISYVGIEDIRAKKLPVTVPKIPSGPSPIPDDTNPPAQLPPTEPKKPTKPPILADKGKANTGSVGEAVKSGG